MATDRALSKEQKQGALASVAGTAPILNPAQVVIDAESRDDGYLKTGTENAATNVAETQIGWLPRQGLLRSVRIIPPSNVANDNTNNVLFTVAVRSSPAYNVATTVATYNTSTQLQGALVSFTPGAAAIVPAAAQIPANAVLTLTITKGGSGQLVPALTTVHWDVEEN